MLLSSEEMVMKSLNSCEPSAPPSPPPEVFRAAAAVAAGAAAPVAGLVVVEAAVGRAASSRFQAYQSRVTVRSIHRLDLNPARLSTTQRQAETTDKELDRIRERGEPDHLDLFTHRQPHLHQPNRNRVVSGDLENPPLLASVERMRENSLRFTIGEH